MYTTTALSSHDLISSRKTITIVACSHLRCIASDPQQRTCDMLIPVSTGLSLLRVPVSTAMCTRRPFPVHMHKWRP